MTLIPVSLPQGLAEPPEDPPPPPSAACRPGAFALEETKETAAVSEAGTGHFAYNCLLSK